MSNYVSLGGNCAPSYALKVLGLKKETGYFDWTNSSINKVNKILEEGFKDAESIVVIKKSNKYPLINDKKKKVENKDTKGSFILKNNIYGIKFAHELESVEELPEFIESLKRRIIRFKQLENPTFIRLETSNLSQEKTKTSYTKLETMLESYFGVYYKIILISKHKYESTRVHWIKLDDFSSDWTYPNVDWKSVFII